MGVSSPRHIYIEMASEDIATAEKEDEIPEYLREVHDVKFLNISMKGYEKKTVSSGFSKEEFYAYRIVSMYVCSTVDLMLLPSEEGNMMGVVCG